MGLLERTSQKVKTVQGLIGFLIAVGVFTFIYTQSIPLTLLTIIIAAIIFVVWDMYERLVDLEKVNENKFKRLKNRRGN